MNGTSIIEELEHEADLNGGYCGDLSESNQTAKLNELTDLLTEDYTRISTDNETLKAFLASFKTLDAQKCDRLIDLVLAVFDSELSSLDEDLREGSHELFLQHFSVINSTVFFVGWTVKSAEDAFKTFEIAHQSTSSKKSLASKRSKWDWPKQRMRLFLNLQRLLNASLKAIFVSSVELDTTLASISKTIFQYVLEIPENSKNEQLRNAVFNVLCTIASKYSGVDMIKNEIMICLRSHEHLAEPMAHLTHMLFTQYETPQVGELVFHEIADMEFRERESISSTTRSIAKYLIKESELDPKEVLKVMVHHHAHIDAESYTMRCAALEIIGNLVLKIQLDLDHGGSSMQIEKFFDVLVERFRDSNSFVRSKLLQVLSRLCELRPNGNPAIPKLRLFEIARLASGRLRDKAVNVRRQAVKFLTTAIDTHPFSMNDRKLRRSVFEKSRKELEHTLSLLLSSDELSILFASKAGPLLEKAEDDSEDAAQLAASPVSKLSSDNPFLVDEQPADDTAERPSEEEISKLQLIYQYYCDAIKFLDIIEAAIPHVCALLGSANRQEVIDAMDFFHLATFYEIEGAEQGIKRMVHLVWSRDLNMSSSGALAGELSAGAQKTVRDCLLDTFEKLYFSEKSGESAARDLIDLCARWSLAELTSLETLLGLLAKQKRVPVDVYEALWTLMSVPHQQDCLGATMLMSMFALWEPKLIKNQCANLVKATLQPTTAFGLKLAKYGSVALQRLSSESNLDQQERYAADHLVIQRLCGVLLYESTDPNWIEMAEQAINAVYVLAKCPDIVASQILTALTKSVFSTQAEFQSTRLLAQLLFVAGHISIKQTVHLELIEAEWKRRIVKAAKETDKADNAPEDDLGAVVGGAEDEAAEVMHAIREQELLFGKSSLLAMFGLLVVHICANKSTFSDIFLQRMAVLCLCKFMCVSHAFCEAQLPLFLTILSKTDDKIIQSNMIIALGDIAVCFNALVDRNIEFLYEQLNSSDLHVKKNALMVLSHLVLNGMVKVKGQISEMAKCLEDDNASIRDLARLFFSELSTKDNVIFNQLPDVISSLSADTKVSEAAFQSVMRFLFSFSKRERQLESMIDKLCQRFMHASGARQYRDIGFCLSLIPFSHEKSIKRLYEVLPLYSKYLYEDTLHNYFVEILGKAKKYASSDTRLLIADFEVHLEDARAKALETVELLHSVDAAKETVAAKHVEDMMDESR